MQDFERIYSEYYDVVYGYALTLCADEQWAEEITQDAFFKALKNIDTFRGECKLSVWLCQIAKHTFYKAAKHRQRQAGEFPENLPAGENIEQQWCDKETVLQLHHLLHMLEEPYKEVFWMRTFGELSFRDIGKILGKSESWVRVTYHRAKMKVREAVK